MDREVKLDLKLRNNLTDEDMELIKFQLKDIRKTMEFRIGSIVHNRGSILHNRMKERLQIYNLIIPLLTNKELLNNVMNEFDRLYTLYETEKMTDDELDFLTFIAENYREFQINLLRLCSAIYVMTDGLCNGLFEEVSNKIMFTGELLYIDEEYLKGTYVNDEFIGRTYVNDVLKVREYCLDVVNYFRTNF